MAVASELSSEGGEGWRESSPSRSSLWGGPGTGSSLRGGGGLGSERSVG